MLVMFIVVLTAVINLSSCKKKDSDPKPNGVSGCATVQNEVTYNGNWYMEYIIRPYSMVYRDTLVSDGMGTFILGTSNNCHNDGRTVHFTFWNSDSSVVRDFDLYCPPNDTAYYTVQ